MDISSAKLPAILILVLIGVLVLQFVSNTDDNSPMIDFETCASYLLSKKYTSSIFKILKSILKNI